MTRPPITLWTLPLAVLAIACGSDSTGPAPDPRCNGIAQVASWTFDAGHQILFDSILPGGDTARIKEGLNFNTTTVGHRHAGGDSVTWSATPVGNAFIHDSLLTHTGGSLALDSAGAPFVTGTAVTVFADLAACTVRIRSAANGSLYSRSNGGTATLLGPMALGGEQYGPYAVVDSVVTAGLRVGDPTPAAVVARYFSSPDSATGTAILAGFAAGNMLGGATTVLGDGTLHLRLIP